MIIKALMCCLLLQGSVDNRYGRIGIKVSLEGRVGKVYSHSPAKVMGLQTGDLIISADGHKGTKFIDGCANTQVLLEVKRNKFVFYLQVPRVPPEEIFDEEEQPRDTRIEGC